ncbi:MAG: 2-hydroxyacyl-CoA dehydratase [Campylobacteraceae bacterium]|nr:2-hydroxyacyl-CoA dehydratase [Campylobacteraceae bacterium]
MSLAELKQKNAAELANLKEHGQRVVGMFCTYSPRELIIAADAIAVSLCANDESPISVAEKELPRNLCPLIKASYGYSVNGNCPYMRASDLIVGETTCDGKKKMYELMKNQRDVYVMELPNMTNEKSLELWVSEMHRFKEALEKKFNTTITDEKLKDAVILQNKERELMLEIMDLAKLDPSPITGSEMHDILFSNDFIFDKKEKFKVLEEMLSEFKEKANSPFNQNKNKKRILITGCPSGGVADKIIKEIEKFDAIVVGFENCVGRKNFEYMVETDGDLYENLAKRYLKIPCSVMYRNETRCDNLKRLISEFKADGVIDITLSACHTYAIESTTIKQTCKDAGAGFLHIETDYSKQDTGQVRTRLEAFIELL